MPSYKRLRSVAKSTCQHSLSGLSYLVPHIRETFAEFKIRSLTLNLCKADPCPDEYRSNRALVLALKALQERFVEILCSEGFSLLDIGKASITFNAREEIFAKDYQGDYSVGVSCSTLITTLDGREIKRSDPGAW